MSITALTGAAASKLRSTQVVTDSVSLIKELIDNALDAGADNVIITVAANLLDFIKVTDNGRGVSLPDRLLLGKRSHTSKIKTLGDLEALGGASLGFRGEALASIAQLSGKGLLITTRVDGEKAGSRLTIDCQGCLIKQENAATGVGMVILVQDVLKAVPVRYKRAIQTAKKDGARLKELVRSYAFARPGVRLQLKLVGSKNKDAGLDYIPPKHTPAALAGAAFSLLGQAFLAGCVIKIGPNRTDTYSCGSYTFEALLPSPELWETDSWCPKNCGQYVAIDSRPVSVKRGIGKDVVKTLKQCMNAAGGQPVTNAPFLALAIHCPPYSYDVNVEPAKDDVAFVDPSKVLSMIEALFREVYRARTIPTRPETQPSILREDDHTDGGSDAPGKEQPDGEQSYLGTQTRKPSRHTNSTETSVEGNALYSRRLSGRLIPNDDHLSRDEDEVEDENDQAVGKVPSGFCEPVEQLPAVITNPWTLAQLQKPGKHCLPESASSDNPLPAPGLDSLVKLPPTPSSSMKPPAERLRSTPENRIGLYNPGRDDVSAFMSGLSGSQRRLNFDAAPKPNHSSTFNADTSVDGCRELQQQEPASSTRRPKSSQSPSITLNDIPDIRELRTQHQSIATRNPPYRPVVKRHDTGRQSRLVAKSRNPGYERQMQIYFEPDPGFDSPPASRTVLSYDSSPEPHCDSVRSLAGTLSRCNSRGDIANLGLAQSAPRYAPAVEDDNHLSPYDRLIHREHDCCSKLVWTSNQTTTAIANMALGEPLPIVIDNQEDVVGPGSSVFSHCSNSDAECWQRAIRRHLERMGAPEDDLRSLETDLSKTLNSCS